MLRGGRFDRNERSLTTDRAPESAPTRAASRASVKIRAGPPDGPRSTRSGQRPGSGGAGRSRPFTAVIDNVARGFLRVDDRPGVSASGDSARRQGGGHGRASEDDPWAIPGLSPYPQEELADSIAQQGSRSPLRRSTRQSKRGDASASRRVGTEDDDLRDGPHADSIRSRASTEPRTGLIDQRRAATFVARVDVLDDDRRQGGGQGAYFPPFLVASDGIQTAVGVDSASRPIHGTGR